MKVLFFGRYDRDYSRNRVLLKGLRLQGVEVQECGVAPTPFWFIRLFVHYIRLRPFYDVMLVAFPGQEVVFLARLLSSKPILFDAFTSHYGGYLLDRNYYSKTSMRSRYYRFLDTWSCRLATHVLLDTQAHIDFFVQEFGIPVSKFTRVFVGTDTDIFYPRESTPKETGFLVHFHGNFIPLQGVQTIIRAAKLLENQDVTFNLIGRGQTYEKSRALATQLGIHNVTFIDPVAYEELAGFMARADVCLGIFGETSKTQLVIPNKLFEALAMKKPVITADTPAARELLNDTDAILIRTDSPEALTHAILRLKNDAVFRESIAARGYQTFLASAIPSILGAQLVSRISRIL